MLATQTHSCKTKMRRATKGLEKGLQVPLAGEVRLVREDKKTPPVPLGVL